MFHLRVTIEVINDAGQQVNHQGYAITPSGRGMTLKSTQELWAEGGKPMAIASANNRLNSLHGAIKAIGETVNG